MDRIATGRGDGFRSPLGSPWTCRHDSEAQCASANLLLVAGGNQRPHGCDEDNRRTLHIGSIRQTENWNERPR